MTKEGWVVLWSLVIPVVDSDVESFWGALSRDLGASEPPLVIPSVLPKNTGAHLPGRSTTFRLERDEAWLKSQIPHFPYSVLDAETIRGLLFFWLQSGWNNFLFPRFGQGDFNTWYQSYLAAFSMAGVELPSLPIAENPTEDTIVFAVACLATGSEPDDGIVSAVRGAYGRIADAYGERITSGFEAVSRRSDPGPWSI